MLGRVGTQRAPDSLSRGAGTIMRSVSERSAMPLPVRLQSQHFIKVVLRVWSMLGLYTISVPEFIFICMV